MAKNHMQIAPDISVLDNLSPLLSEDSEIQNIINRARTVTLMPKDKITWGAASNEKVLYILRSGVMKLRAHIGQVDALELIYPGAFFGGLSHLSNDGTLFEVSALETSNVVQIDQQTFVELQRVGSKFFSYYMTAMSLYMSTLRGDYNLLTELSLKTRLARALYKDFKKRGTLTGNNLTVTKILSQEEWALMLRARRETVSRAFAEFEREGTLDDAGSSYTLLSEFNLVKIIAESSRSQSKTS
jgi:CRP-like cAMP-binding protein